MIKRIGQLALFYLSLIAVYSFAAVGVLTLQREYEWHYILTAVLFGSITGLSLRYIKNPLN